MKIIKWSFEKICESKALVLNNNLFMEIGQYEGFIFDIVGLGLTKSERELLDRKLFQRGNFINIYLGKLIITYDKRGYMENLSSVNIDWELKLKDYIRNFVRYTIEPKLKEKFNNLISKGAKKMFFRKKEIFIIQESYCKPKKIRCDKLTAFQLASNYEADLFQNGSYLLSPLGFDWDSNRKLIVKHLGRVFNHYKLYGYANWDEVEVMKYK